MVCAEKVQGIKGKKKMRGSWAGKRSNREAVYFGLRAFIGTMVATYAIGFAASAPSGPWVMLALFAFVVGIMPVAELYVQALIADRTDRKIRLIMTELNRAHEIMVQVWARPAGVRANDEESKGGGSAPAGWVSPVGPAKNLKGGSQ